MSLTYAHLYINGQWQAPVLGGSFTTDNPSDESPLATLPAATKEDVERAVTAARAAFDEGPWPQMSGAERAVYLRKIAALIREQTPMLAELEVRDNGKPLPEALWDIGDAAGCFDYYANLAEESDQTLKQEIKVADERFSSWVEREPVGVVGAIIPWNYPLLMATWKVAPAMAAGCTIVLKPSELTSITALELARIIDEAGVPAGVFNLVTGMGPDAGAPLAEHPLVDKLAFTGSVPTGKRIMQAAAKDVKNLSLELGGKSPFIVFADSDIEKAVEWIMFGIFWNQGQVCSATSRVLVERALYPKLIERLVAEAAKITLGNGLEEGILLGPLVSRGQYEKVMDFIEQGKASGATLAYGGKRPASLDKGYFLEPTIFTDVPIEASIWREEIFAPVVCINAFDTEAEARRLANDSPFGLAAAVMSEDVARAERFAKGLRAGIIWINCSQPTFTEAPWGGYKQSGIGRELGQWGFDNYREVKQVTRYDSPEPWGWYIK